MNYHDNVQISQKMKEHLQEAKETLKDRNLYNKAKNTLNNKEDKEMVELLEDVSYNIMKRSIQNELGGIYV